MVGIQSMAYGGARPVPFQQAAGESQILEPGITGEYTRHAMQRLVDVTGCSSADLNSSATISCLRDLSTQELLHAQIQTHHELANLGDEWLPAVDEDFLPAAPSQLIAERRFAKTSTMIGCCEDDGNLFVPRTLDSDMAVLECFSSYLPGMTFANVRKLLSLCPVSDFSTNSSANLSAQYYRAGRIMRDILFTCQRFYYGQALADAGNTFFLYD